MFYHICKLIVNFIRFSKFSTSFDSSSDDQPSVADQSSSATEGVTTSTTEATSIDVATVQDSTTESVKTDSYVSSFNNAPQFTYSST